MASSSTSQYLLRWNDHLSNYGDVFLTLREQEEFVDCSIACDDGIVGAHRVVLAGCSSYLRDLFTRIANPHPVIFLMNTPRSLVIMLLEFIYKGQVHIPQNRLQQLVMLGQSLRIKGLQQIAVPVPEVSSPPNTLTPMAFPHGLPISPTPGMAYRIPSEGVSNLGVSILSCDMSQEEQRKEIENANVQEMPDLSQEGQRPIRLSRRKKKQNEKLSRKNNDVNFRMKRKMKSLKIVHPHRYKVKPGYNTLIKNKCYIAAYATEHGIESTKSYAKSLYDVDMRTSTIIKWMNTFDDTEIVQKAKEKAAGKGKDAVTKLPVNKGD
ncbi:protein jim lovell [Procambarus clarkii]|uniref:protein jim lovell n=1 Tax=Procambarus clarkii TaxID=6728 RepID=UPI003741F27A